MKEVTAWKAQEVAAYLRYIERIAEKIAGWRAEHGYTGMVSLVDYQRIGSKWKELARQPEQMRRRVVEKLVDAHFESLQDKVEARIGKIKQIKTNGDNGADYLFVGETGNAEIRVVAAGGHNIQCAHTRWIFIKR